MHSLPENGQEQKQKQNKLFLKINNKQTKEACNTATHTPTAATPQLHRKIVLYKLNCRHLPPLTDCHNLNLYVLSRLAALAPLSPAKMPVLLQRRLTKPPRLTQAAHPSFCPDSTCQAQDVLEEGATRKVFFQLGLSLQNKPTPYTPSV